MRVLNRTNHITLGNDNPMLATKIICSYYHSYKNIAFDDHFLENFDLDAYLKVNITQDNKHIMIPKNLEQAVNSCLKVCSKFTGTPSDEPEFDNLVNLI